MTSYSMGQKPAFKCRITLDTRGFIFSACCRVTLRSHRLLTHLP